MGKKSKKKSHHKLPPCVTYLNEINNNPIFRDGKIIYGNDNRVYCFISTYLESNDSDALLSVPITTTNIQISLETFLIGWYISEVQNKKIAYTEDASIHADKITNEFIHNALKKYYQEIKADAHITITYSLSLLISNSNAIIPFFTSTQNITALNYIILFALNRLESDPGLFYANNSFVTVDPINLDLSKLELDIPYLKIDK